MKSNLYSLPPPSDACEGQQSIANLPRDIGREGGEKNQVKAHDIQILALP